MKVKIRSFDNKLIEADAPQGNPRISKLICYLTDKYGYRNDHIHLSCNNRSISRDSEVI